MKKQLARLVGLATSTGLFLGLATSAFAQFATDSGQTKGGTVGSLPNAGSTEITYLIFVFGILLFVFGMLKLALSWRD